MRGSTAATLQVCTNLVGYGMGPLAVGMLSDFYGGPQSLRYAIMTMAGICLILSSLHFALSARALDRLLGRKPL
jgi:hypothetical protein